MEIIFPFLRSIAANRRLAKTKGVFFFSLISPREEKRIPSLAHISNYRGNLKDLGCSHGMQKIRVRLPIKIIFFDKNKN